MDNSPISGLALLLIAAALIAVVSWFVMIGVNFMEVSTMECTVSDKERVTTRDSSRFLIFCEEGEVLQNTDSIYHLKLNSADVYGQLKEGETYQLDVYGRRIYWASWNRNILEIKE